MGQVVHEASGPWGEMSMGRNVHGASCPWGEFVYGGNVIGRAVQRANSDQASCEGHIVWVLAA
jgi:hypothetical protein